MGIKLVIEQLNEMAELGIIADYAIGGAVGATFYLEPVATVDVDVFISIQAVPMTELLNPLPIFDFLRSRGFEMHGEYVMVGGWPVQFLASSGSLVDEGMGQAVVMDVEGAPARVMPAEYLAAIALQTGRAKDIARVHQFLEAGVLDRERFKEVLERHRLTTKLPTFEGGAQ